jgi:hypothetical protein
MMTTNEMDVDEDLERITFRDLSDFDDICTELLLDKLFLGFKTHKMSPEYATWLDNVDPLESTFLREFLPILQHGVVNNRNTLIPAQELFRRMERGFPHPREAGRSEFASEVVYGSLRQFVDGLSGSKTRVEGFIE